MKVSLGIYKRNLSFGEVGDFWEADKAPRNGSTANLRSQASSAGDKALEGPGR